MKFLILCLITTSVLATSIDTGDTGTFSIDSTNKPIEQSQDNDGTSSNTENDYNLNNDENNDSYLNGTFSN